MSDRTTSSEYPSLRLTRLQDRRAISVTKMTDWSRGNICSQIPLPIVRVSDLEIISL